MKALGRSCEADGNVHSTSGHGSEAIRRKNSPFHKAGSIHFLGDLSGAAGQSACRAWHDAGVVPSALVQREGQIEPWGLFFGQTGRSVGPTTRLTS